MKEHLRSFHYQGSKDRPNDQGRQKLIIHNFKHFCLNTKIISSPYDDLYVSTMRTLQRLNKDSVKLSFPNDDGYDDLTSSNQVLLTLNLNKYISTVINGIPWAIATTSSSPRICFKNHIFASWAEVDLRIFKTFSAYNSFL